MTTMALRTACAILSGGLLLGTAITGSGCNHSASKPRPLEPQTFYPGNAYQGAQNPVGERRIQEDPRAELDQTQRTSGVTFPKPRQPDPLPPPKITPVTQPATASTTRPSSALPPGQYQLIGTVVAEVNGAPIYANKVLALINKPLMQKARELRTEEFRAFAAQLIRSQVEELIRDEVLYAAAERSLSDQDKRLADAMTQQWRMQQITLAGGSVQVARSRAAAEGDDFDELVRQRYRKHIIEVYHYKKITPRIQVTVDDQRRYYDKHKDDEFTEHQAARFRVLEVSVDKTGSRELALKKAAALYQRAAAGEDFTAMCARENDNSAWAAMSGDTGWLAKGSFKYEKVEEEVWKLQPGQVTQVIETDKAYYLAKLEQVRPGRVRPFGEQPNGKQMSVQEQITDKLRKEQFRELSDEMNQRLQKDAIVNRDPARMQLCLDMAMQRYAAVARN
jgi:parvulin-like peptidyl-prolyl isomerase